MQSWLLWKRKHLHRLVKMIEQLLQWHFNFWVKRVIAISITNIYLASVLYTVTNLDQGRAAMGRRKERNVELCRYFCSCCLVSPFFWLRFAVSSLAERFLHVRWPIMTNCKGRLTEPTNCYASPALVLSLRRTAQQQQQLYLYPTLIYNWYKKIAKIWRDFQG